MIEPPLPRFQWGQRVASLVDLFNDGSFPQAEPDALLVAEGSQGEIRQLGLHVESGTNVYLVEFGPHVIGCCEDEIIAVERTS